METIGKMKYALLIALVILALMIVKASETRAWKGKITEAAEMAASGRCFITLPEVKEISDRVFFIRIGDPGSDSISLPVNIPLKELTFSDLAGKKLPGDFTDRNGRYVIVSGSRSDGIKAWLMLNQLGMKNASLLAGWKGEDEKLKYRFQPESINSPEPASPGND